MDDRLLTEISGDLLIRSGSELSIISMFLNSDHHSELGNMDVLCYSEDGDALPSMDKAVTESIAVIPVAGVMYKYPTVYSPGTAYIGSVIRSVAQSGKFSSIILSTDSPGGTISSVPPILDAIDYARSEGLKVIGSVDLGCSGAYWMLSACDYIFSTNDISSEVGSIGVKSVHINLDKYMENIGISETTLYAPESTKKDHAYRLAKEGDFSVIIEELSLSAQKFQNDVKRRRQCIANDPDVFSGNTFPASRALTLGMIDGITPLDDLIKIVPSLISM